MIGDAGFDPGFEVGGLAIALEPFAKEPVRCQHQRREHRRSNQDDAEDVADANHQSIGNPCAKRPGVHIGRDATAAKVEEHPNHQRHDEQSAKPRKGPLEDAGNGPNRRPRKHHQEEHNGRREAKYVVDSDDRVLQEARRLDLRRLKVEVVVEQRRDREQRDTTTE